MVFVYTTLHIIITCAISIHTIDEIKKIPLLFHITYDGNCTSALCPISYSGGNSRLDGYVAPVAGIQLAYEDLMDDFNDSIFSSLTINMTSNIGKETLSANTSIFISQNNLINLILAGELDCGVRSGIAAVYNKLMINFLCMPTEKQEIERLQVIYMQPLISSYSNAIIKLLRYFNTTRVAILNIVPTNPGFFSKATVNFHDQLMKSLFRKLEDSNDVQIVHMKIINDNAFNILPTYYFTSDIAQFVLQSYLKTRMFIVLQMGDKVRIEAIFLNCLERFGLLQTGEFFTLFIQKPTVTYSGTEEAFRRFVTGEDFIYRNLHFYQHKKINYVRGFLNFRSAATIIPSQDVYAAESIDFNIRAEKALTYPKCPPICGVEASYINITKYNLPNIYSKVAAAYDSVMLYMNAFKKMYKENSSSTYDLSTLFNMITGISYTGILNTTILIDPYGFAKTEFLVLSSNGKDEYSPVATLTAISRNDYGYEISFKGFNRTFWKLAGQSFREPSCGFNGELCQRIKDYIPYIVAAFATLLVIFGGIFVTMCCRILINEKRLASMIWKIYLKDLVLQQINFQSMASMKSFGSNLFTTMKSTTTLRMNYSHASLRAYDESTNLNKNVQQRNKQKDDTFVHKETDKWLKSNDFEVALYKGNIVGVKKVFKTNVAITRSIQTELKTIIELSHENLNRVVGAVNENPFVFIVSDFCQRGALKDLLENDDIQLDNIFSASITNDITRGLAFIHESVVAFHGRLKSSNCLVDSRWVVKLSSFGLNNFRAGENPPLTEEQKCREQLWSAPEQLRGTLSGKDGNQKSDIYSLGIILHEIFARKGPFGDDLMDPTDAIDRIKFPKNGIFYRPNMHNVDDIQPFMKATMVSCWNEDPTKRPKVVEVKKDIKPLLHGLKNNILDNMIDIMEKYASNLEVIVAERTRQLEEEKRKSERLLLMMLPKSVAEQLKRGEAVEAETFDSVTIYFSDIVGFTSLSSESTPIQIVAFLNDLYTCFDSIIDKYDVYKVETIGDAYMVVSGLPMKNGNNHAGEIASMSLNLLSTIKIFKIRHRPNQILMLRIGIHSGHCVSGVVGLKMPRYCLFGDTVNTASRMESNGEALKIHGSTECKQILDQLGGYTVEERGIVTMKGKGDLRTFWITAQDENHRKQRLILESNEYPSLKKCLRFIS